MKQNRTDSQGVPNRSSNMEQAEGSRDTAFANERMSGSEGERMRGSDERERMRGSDSASQDLGSSSDRAMFSERGSAESRIDTDRGSGASGSGGRGSSGMRGSGSSGERNMGSAAGSRSNAGGITNRSLDREQSEQDQLPERGRSQSER